MSYSLSCGRDIVSQGTLVSQYFRKNTIATSGSRKPNTTYQNRLTSITNKNTNQTRRARPKTAYRPMTGKLPGGRMKNLLESPKKSFISHPYQNNPDVLANITGITYVSQSNKNSRLPSNERKNSPRKPEVYPRKPNKLRKTSRTKKFSSKKMVLACK